MYRNSTIYEVANLMRNPQNIQDDFSLVINSFRDTLTEKYIGKMNKVVSEHRERVMNSPPKEVVFMQAMKPFMPVASQRQLDNIIDTIVLMNTYNSIRSELDCPYGQGHIHPDGIYEVDPNCRLRQHDSGMSMDISGLGLILMLSLMSKQ